MLKIAYNSIYKYQLPEGHRFPMEKYELIPEQLLYEGTITEENFFDPGQLTLEEIKLTHDHDYVDRLEQLALTPKEVRKIGFPLRRDLIERGKYIAKGTYLCAAHAKLHGVALNIAGGTHHSFAGHGEGFCVYNDIAIASNLMVDRSEASKILVIDLDVHQGNGTAKLFEDRPEVFTFSVHGEKNYPTKKMQSDLDIGLPDKTEDDLYLSTIKDTIPRLIDEVKPDFVFYLSGVDILASDKLGRLSVTREGCKERDRYVLQTLYDLQLPVAISMGGGYSPQIRDIIEAHANTFRLAQEIFF